MLTKSEDFKRTYPDAKLGILIMNDVKNLKTNPEFMKTKSLLKEQLLTQYKNYDRKEFVKSEPMYYYKNYYKKFKKTYPVLLQLESVVLKSNPIPNVSTIVEAMFISELKNMLLTAAHDLDKIEMPIQLNLTHGTESFIGISSKEQFTAANDMMLSDQKGIISSILNGPDYRTRITNDTRNVLFCVYAPTGIDNITIHNHLNDIIKYVSIFSPNSKVHSLNIF